MTLIIVDSVGYLTIERKYFLSWQFPVGQNELGA